jgi:hypothetical protein
VQQKAVAKYINDNYPNAQNIVECGSGHGGLARYIARKTNTNVIGLENGPFCVFLSRFFSLFCRANFQTINTDMFEYLDNTKNNFDVAIAYLGPSVTPLLQKYDKKIKVLISLNFEVPNLKPVRIVDLKKGFVLYNYKKYPHKLFIYEFTQKSPVGDFYFDNKYLYNEFGVCIFHLFMPIACFDSCTHVLTFLL